MSQHTSDRTNTSTRENGPYGQVASLFLWPLLTVLLVLGVLYFDRVSMLREMSANMAAVEIEMAGHLLEAAGGSVAGDLQLLAGDYDLAAVLSGTSTTAARQRLGAFLERLAESNPLYERIRLLDGRGTVLLQVAPSLGEQAVPAGGTEIFGTGAGGVVTSPPVMIFRSSDGPGGAGQIVRFALVIETDGNHQGGVIEISYRLSCLLEMLQKTGLGADAELYVLNGTWYETRPGLQANDRQKGRDDYGPLSSGLEESGLLPVLGRIGRNEKGSFSSDGNFYSYSFFQTHLDMQEGTGGRWLIVAKTPTSYFAGEKSRYVHVLVFLAAALLVPSFVVCFYLAKARTKAAQETALRFRQQEQYLTRLEEGIRQRTSDLDERNLQLSREIAERLKTEKQLQQSNELLSGMLGSIDGIIYVSDFKTHEILFANEYLKELFGFDPVGKPCWQFIHSSKDGPCVFCTNHMLLEDDGEPAAPYQWEYQNPFNKKWYAAKDQAIRWSDGRYVKLEIAVDITEQKRLQHFLNEARKQAELAKGIRSRFVALVAHDLKSPFYSMTLMIKRILERETFSHRVHEQFLENIVNNGQRMLQMIDNLLAMNRFEAGDLKLDRTFFDVSRMADEVLQNFSPLAIEKGIRLGNSIPGRTMLYADKYLFFVVLNNLVSNAIKFCDRGGLIELFQPDPGRPMTIAVRDNGQGMSQDFADNLFKADIKTSSRGTGGEQGSGLGLIFCQEIIEAHAGTIRVVSEPGLGTTFFLCLPECSSLERDLRDFETAD